MIDHGVPDWYIWSCERIKYMFPKAHAAAYVMMAWRVAYCKVFYPLAYYTAYFSIRATAFDYEKMAMSPVRLEHYIAEYKAKKAEGTISNTEEDEAQKANYNSVIIEIIRQSEKNYEDAMSNAKKELEANLQKAINLLQP